MPNNTPPRSGSTGVSSLFGDSLDNFIPSGTQKGGVSNYLQGNGGRDTLIASDPKNSLIGSGSNTLVGNSNKGSSLVGGSGTNLFYLNNANDTLLAPSGSRNSIQTTLTGFTLGLGENIQTRIDSLSYAGVTPAKIIGDSKLPVTIDAASAIAATLGDGSKPGDYLVGSASGRNLFLVSSLGDHLSSVRGGTGSGTIMTGASLNDDAFKPAFVTGVQALNLTSNAKVTLGTNAGSAGISSVFSSSASLSPGVAVDAKSFPRSLAMVGGAGDDTFTLSATMLDRNTITGGAGNLTVALSGPSTLADTSFSKLSKVKGLNLLSDNSSATLGAKASAAGISTVIAGKASTTVNASTFNRGLTFSVATDKLSGDVLRGSSFNDTLALSAAGSLGDTAFGGKSSLEFLSLTSPTAITLGAAAAAAGISSVVTGLGPDTVTAKEYTKGLTFFSAPQGLGADILRGSAFKDTLAISGPATLPDNVFGGKTSLEVLSLTSPSNITLGAAAAAAGISTVVAGSGMTSLNAYNLNRKLTLDASASTTGINYRGTEKAGDLILLNSKALNSSSLVGGSGIDTLAVTDGKVSLTSFNNVLSIDVLSLSRGGNTLANVPSSVRTIKGGAAGGDSINASAATTSIFIDESASTLGNTLVSSRTVFTTLRGGSGRDLFALNSSSAANNSIVGGGGVDTIQVFGAANLGASAFNAIREISVLSLAGGNNAVGSLQGSGISSIIGNTGSDTMVANVYGVLGSKADRNTSTMTIAVASGSATPNAGFAIGQLITGNGIAKGTTITGISTLSGSVTLTLSKPTTIAIAAGNTVNAWLNGITLDGSLSQGFPPTSAETLRARDAFVHAATLITADNYGTPDELSKDTLSISTLLNNPATYIHRRGDSLVANGSTNILIGGQANPAPLNLGADGLINQYDQSSFQVVGGATLSGTASTSGGSSSGTTSGGSSSFGPVVANTPTLSFYQYQVIDNTLVSGVYADDSLSNTLVGGAGNNLYLINNQTNVSFRLPRIINPSTLQSGSTIQLTGDSALLSDEIFGSVGENAAKIIRTANGNNLVEIGSNAAAIGIQSIFGGNGSDTFTVPENYALPVYLNASKNAVAGTSLVGGADSDTLLGGFADSTLIGRDGNNSLIGGNGKNYITSGYGNSTLDSGIGTSTLQAAGGRNLMVVRNRNTRILIDSSFTQQIPLELDVNTYVNFDPIQSTEVVQFAPDSPDGSPSITKSASFASSDLASFYTIKNFNLLGDLTTGLGAVYGVGNALDNVMTQGVENLGLGQNNPSGALMLGMGGSNTLTSWGSNASLYGFSNESYASPDLYAAAPYDTRTQDFLTNVMGTPGNNLLVANGYASFLDGGPGYNGGNGTPEANTLIGTALNDTFVIRHQADSVVAAKRVSDGRAINTIYSTVDLNQLPDNITDAVLVVADQRQYLQNFSANAPLQPSNSGQDAPATYLSFGEAEVKSAIDHSVTFNRVTFSLPKSSQMQVQYGTFALNHFLSDTATAPETTTRDEFFPLTVSDPIPDTNHPGTVSYQLDWDATLMRSTNVVVGYTVVYRVRDDGSGQPGAWKTYVDGTSNDFQGTGDNPVLVVDNLDPSLTYDFQVTAVQLQHPYTMDSLGNEIATPVTLRGNSGDDILWSYVGNQDALGYGQNFGKSSWYRNVNPVLGNNPAAPLPAGTIPLTGPYSVSHYDSPLFPAYLDGADGDNLLLSRQIENGDGSSWTIEAGTASNPQTLSYGGFNTMEGGKGSDTFVVANGTQNNFDLCIKYGNETPVDYTNKAPFVPSTLSANGVSLNGGQHNLIASAIDRIQLSDTTVSQGMFVDQLLLLGGYQFGMGNRLDNFIYDVDQYSTSNTLVGNTGRDSILGQQRGDLLIGGTAALGDNIKLAMAGMYGARSSIVGGVAGYYTADGDGNYTIRVTSSTPTLQGSSTVFSAYRDSDPVPATLQGGPGTVDTSQYWFVSGSGNYDPLRNSDTLFAIPGGAGDSLTSFSLDGGAGADSLFGSTGGDYLVVSTGGIYGENYTGAAYGSFYPIISDRDNATGTMYGGYGDVVVGNGGNDTICFTGSDLWWSGNPSTYSTPLTYLLTKEGDAQGGQSISNIILQSGAPNAIGAIGNAYSTGNQHKGNLGTAELGSNKLIGNEFANYLDGAGVGGSGGQGYGADTLTGDGGSDTFAVGANYRSSSQDVAATYTTAQSGSPVVNTYSTSADKAATDADYVTITDFATTGSTDVLSFKGTIAGYAIGAAPSSFAQHNIPLGTPVDPKHFGIYYVNGTNVPNLVAEVTTDTAISLGSTYLTVAGQSVNGTTGFGAASFAWTTGTASDLNAGGLNYLGFGAMYPISYTDLGQTLPSGEYKFLQFT